MLKETPAKARSGFGTLFLLFVLQIVTVALVITMPPLLKVLALLAGIGVFICWFGFYMVQPNQSAVLQLFGSRVLNC